MIESVPFLVTTIAGGCLILFRRQLTQSTARWQHKFLDVTYGARGIKLLERWHVVVGVFFLLIGLLHLFSLLQ